MSKCCYCLASIIRNEVLRLARSTFLSRCLCVSSTIYHRTNTTQINATEQTFKMFSIYFFLFLYFVCTFQYWSWANVLEYDTNRPFWNARHLSSDWHTHTNWKETYREKERERRIIKHFSCVHIFRFNTKLSSSTQIQLLLKITCYAFVMHHTNGTTPVILIHMCDQVKYWMQIEMWRICCYVPLRIWKGKKVF